jgi:hypothetical protein
LIDPKAETRIGRIGFVRFATAEGSELVFTTSQLLPTGIRGKLVAVGFRAGEASVDYFWSGLSGVSFRVTGTDVLQRVVATAGYRTVVDPRSQPARAYRFTIGLRHGLLGVLHDDRPWIGLSVAGTDRSRLAPLGSLRSHLLVLAVVPHSPAAAHFRVGDVIVGLTPERPWKRNLLGPALIDQIADERAGTRVVFTIHRGSDYLKLPFRLGSVIDRSGPGTAPATNPNFALI